MLNVKFLVADRSKPTVVFLHGFLESLTMWEYLNIRDHFNCILVDLPGHGKSPIDPTDLTMFSMADQVLDMLAKHKIGQYHIVGHSMGGYVALAMKSMDKNCSRLVLLNSNFWSDSDEKKKDRLRVADLVQSKKEAFVREAIPNLFMSPDAYISDVQQLINDAQEMEADTIARSSVAMSQRHDFTDTMNNWNTDILVIQGQYDNVVPASVMKAKCKVSGLNCFELPTGHMAHIELTEEINTELKRFLK